MIKQLFKPLPWVLLVSSLAAHWIFGVDWIAVYLAMIFGAAAAEIAAK